MIFAGTRISDYYSRKRFIGVQYAQAIRDKLKFAAGESGYGTLLGKEKSLLPLAVMQLYNAGFKNFPVRVGFKDLKNSPSRSEPSLENRYLALMIPRRKQVYGFEQPVMNANLPEIMRRLQKSSFHGPDVDGMLFYAKDSPGYVTSNPYCDTFWGEWSEFFTEEKQIKIPGGFPKLADFISDSKFARDGLVSWPIAPVKPVAPTKPEPDRFDAIAEREIAAAKEGAIRQRAIAELCNICQWASPDAIAIEWDDAKILFGPDVAYRQKRDYVEGQLRKGYGQPIQPNQTYPSYDSPTYSDSARTFIGQGRTWAQAPFRDWRSGLAVENAALKPAKPAEPELKSKTGRMVLLKDPE